MDIANGQVVSKKEFLSGGLFDKEHYEGLFVCIASDGKYRIGIQLDHDRVLKVDESEAEQVREKIYRWAPEVARIQSHWGHEADLQNYDRPKH